MADEVKAEELDITDELIAERRAGAPGETPDDMTPWMRPVVAGIDLMNLWVGRVTCLMLIPIIIVMVWEVVSRKMFLAPTAFSYEYSRMLAGAMFMMGAGYALMRGVHIRADFIYRNWSHERQATVDTVLYMLFYFPAMLFFLWISTEFTIKAWATGERSMASAMMAPLAPARTAMPLAALFLTLQGISEVLKALYDMSPGRRAKFLRFMPVYIVGLAAIFASIVFADVLPFDEWWSGLVGGVGLGAISSEMIGLLMIAVMLFSIFVGFPISFTLIFLGFVFGAWGFGGKLTFYLQTFQFNATMLDDQLVAVPLFVFMGIMMEQAGLMERLFTSVQLMFSRTRGSLYVAVLFVSTIFAAATGIVGASVTILGIMAARTMNKSGYDVRLSAGAITAGGTLGILIPPSIMLVVMGPVLEVPVTDLFAAAIVPGIMLAFLYMAYALVRCWLNPDLGPILPVEDQPETSPYYFLEFVSVMAALVILCWLAGKGLAGGLSGLFPLSGLLIPLAWVGVMVAVYKWVRVARPGGFYYSELWSEFFLGLVPPTTLVAFALGAILLGWATPAEAAATGAFGAIVLAIGYRKLTMPKLYDALIKTLEISVLIMFLVAASNFFGAVFSRLGTPTMLTELLLAWDLSQTSVLIIIMALIFLLGWPLEWVPIVLIIVPILIPALIEMEVNLTWFGILVAVNLQTAWLSPPVALSAYFLKGVVPEWDLKDIYLGMMQFMVIQMIGLILIFIFPQIALWLPAYVYGP
jgi:TRAP-type mannitol/chloroaromatic compound transport system permease large subunit/TRAP-type mannitol/chloroaromatic compound transport system permease small subunit